MEVGLIVRRGCPDRLVGDRSLPASEPETASLQAAEWRMEYIPAVVQDQSVAMRSSFG